MNNINIIVFSKMSGIIGFKYILCSHGGVQNFKIKIRNSNVKIIGSK